MTSKEMTIKRIENLKIEIGKEKKENGRISLWAKLQLEYYEKVLKDLEILEILKKYLKVKSLELGIEDIIICCENEKEFKKIKEWLNNDK